MTVPACRACNQGAGKDEEYFLATFMFSEAGVTATGKALWKQRLRRMYEKNSGLRRRIAANLSWKNATTPAGILLGPRMALRFDEKRLDRVVKKIVRGLYHFEYKDFLPADADVMVLYLSTKDRFDTARTYINQVGWGQRTWPDVFEYKHGRVAAKPTWSLWLIRFYGRICYWAVTSTADDG